MVDIEGYSRHAAVTQVDAQRRLRQVTEYACGQAGVDIEPGARQDQGDGQLLLLPTGLNEPHVVAALLDGLRDALFEVNNTVRWGRMRLRAAISQGAIQVAATGYVGPAVVTAARLLDSSELRSALAKRHSSDLAVIVTDDLYRDVVSQGHPGLAPALFRRVDVSNRRKAFKATGWLRIVDPPTVDPAVMLPTIDEPDIPGRDGTGPGWGTSAAVALGGAVLGAAAGLSLPATSWDLSDAGHDDSDHADIHDVDVNDHLDYDDHGDDLGHDTHHEEFQ
ncbi:hypothetical protein KZZ52_17025 [Dactylosporangium sp. AC04546]|uniref:hypothetical protein n=1 Tax=Dactylosporangium sp. AC04546 TaxID=2862460 RepID=UPI001EE0E8EB|nr:hypothetical protein [Dactylosporangium sp. AC04546]WVK87003.1 hypothetical protein KZZ52_17025 [Dactylosporangium sp. AC04546]